MLPKKADGVVNSELFVYGISNVRVVVAGIFPFQVSGRPSSTVYAVAERAANVIKGSFTSSTSSSASTRRRVGTDASLHSKAGVRGRVVKDLVQEDKDGETITTSTHIYN